MSRAARLYGRGRGGSTRAPPAAAMPDALAGPSTLPAPPGPICRRGGLPRRVGAMLTFLARRALLALLVCLAVLTFSFALTRLGGDLAISIAGPNATAAVDVVRKAYGLDRPLVEQFVSWAGRAAVGDFGQSYFFREKVSRLIAD